MTTERIQERFGVEIYDDTWLEDKNEEPGQGKIISSEDLKKDLGDDDDPETRNLQSRN